MKTDKQWIGPIPSMKLSDDDNSCYSPGGSAPVWGGYRTLWDDDSEDWVQSNEDFAWYVSAPHSRPAQMCVNIARDAIKSDSKAILREDGSWDLDDVVSNYLINIGLFEDEINMARRSLEKTDKQRVDEADHWAVESFPRGRYWAHGGGVHQGGLPCGHDCPQLDIDCID